MCGGGWGSTTGGVKCQCGELLFSCLVWVEDDDVIQVRFAGPHPLGGTEWVMSTCSDIISFAGASRVSQGRGHGPFDVARAG